MSLQNDTSISGGEKTENVSISINRTAQGSSSDKNGDDDATHGDNDVIHGDDDAIVIPDASNANVNVNADDGYGSDDSSDDEPRESTNEVDFKASSLVSSLANSTIIQNLCWLLKFYRSNSIRTNHYIITALRRVCEDLELSPMLYQVPVSIYSL